MPMALTIHPVSTIHSPGLGIGVFAPAVSATVVEVTLVDRSILICFYTKAALLILLEFSYISRAVVVG